MPFVCPRPLPLPFKQCPILVIYCKGRKKRAKSSIIYFLRELNERCILITKFKILLLFWNEFYGIFKTLYKKFSSEATSKSVSSTFERTLTSFVCFPLKGTKLTYFFCNVFIHISSPIAVRIFVSIKRNNQDLFCNDVPNFFVNKPTTQNWPFCKQSFGMSYITVILKFEQRNYLIYWLIIRILICPRHNW